jgi:hypothetical protein
VESTCPPSYDFVSDQEVLATVCTAAGTSKLIAMSSDGRHLWEFSTPATSVWPLLMSSQDGSRLVRETLDLNYTPGAFSFIVAEDVRGQSVEVFDAATGKVALTASVNPALDEGGNVAISPSGRRVAVLNGGAIQVFELPAVAGVPGVAGNQVGR